MGNKSFLVDDYIITRLVRVIRDTNILLLPRTRIFDSEYVHPFYAVGKLLHYKSYDEYDKLVVDFGGTLRLVYCKSIPVRKQAITLLCGQYFFIYGMAYVRTDEKKRNYYVLIARALNHFYTPLLAELKKSKRQSKVVAKILKDDEQVDISKIWDIEKKSKK